MEYVIYVDKYYNLNLKLTNKSKKKITKTKK